MTQEQVLNELRKQKLDLLMVAFIKKGKDLDFLKQLTAVEFDKNTLTAEEVEKLKQVQEEQRTTLLEIVQATSSFTEPCLTAFYTRSSQRISGSLAIIVTVASFILFYQFAFYDAPTERLKESKDILIYILGALSAILTQVFSFYFGSSVGSRMRTVNTLREDSAK